jgi:hypothetical protein
MAEEKQACSKINEIISGWMNYTKASREKTSAEVENKALERIKICDTCEVRSGFMCSPFKKIKHAKTGNEVSGCGCFIVPKAYSPESACPAGKW